MGVFDFGGIGRDTIEKEGVARFKLSFGGKPVTEYNYIVTGKVGRAAINLFYTIRWLRSHSLIRINRNATASRPTAYGFSRMPSSLVARGDSHAVPDG
jgi:hypothetical protein